MHRREIILALLALSAVVLLVDLGRPGLFDPNEGIYAEIGREMLRGGDWITPRFNGVVYFEKPPLTYWLVAASYALFGVSETTARLPVAIAGILTILTTAAIGRRLFGPRAGMLAGVALLTSAGSFIFLRNLRTDPVFLACLTATFWAFIRARQMEAGFRETQTSPRGWPDLPVYVFAALALLAKGLIGVVFPALAIGGLALANRDWQMLRDMRPARGALVIGAIAGPWYVAVSVVNPGFFWFFFVNEHVLRFLNSRLSTDYSPQPLWLFLVMAAVWALPWSLFMPSSRRGLFEGRLGRIVPCWLFAVLGFFALTPARLEYYSLPALPAWALWAGRLWDDVTTGETSARRMAWPLAGVALVGVMLALAGAVGLWGHWPGFADVFGAFDAYSRDIEHGILAPPGSYTVPPEQDLFQCALIAGALFLAGAAGAFLFVPRRPVLAFSCVAALMLGVFPLMHHGILLFGPHRSARPIGRAIAEVGEPGDLVVVDGPYENLASLDLYTGGSALVLDGRFGDLAFGGDRLDAQDRFVDGARFEKLWSSGNQVLFVTGSDERATAALRREGSAFLLRSGRWRLLVNRAPCEGPGIEPQQVDAGRKVEPVPGVGPPTRLLSCKPNGARS